MVENIHLRIRAGMPAWRVWRGLVLVLAFSLLGAAAQAADGMAQPVGDPAIEARVTKLAEELRCLTCMGQSIADSQSGFSADVKREIRAMVKAGRSDQEVLDFMVQRYGDLVLYRPPVKSKTWLLWGGPFILLVIGLGALLVRLRKRRGEVPGELNEAERRQAEDLLGLREGDKR